ncbi:hypothetical protein D3C72_1328710 [compost metagenome]
MPDASRVSNSPQASESASKRLARSSPVSIVLSVRRYSAASRAKTPFWIMSLSWTVVVVEVTAPVTGSSCSRSRSKAKF